MSTATCTPEVRGASVAETAAEQSLPRGADIPVCPGDGRQEGLPHDKPTTANRDAKGRFGPGNLGGPGNPFARQMAKFRSFIMNCNTAEHMTFAFSMLMKMIADENIQALKLYFLYFLGKPAEMVDPDKLDVDEMNGYKATAGILDEATALMKAPTSDFPLAMLRIGKAAATQKMRDFTVHNLEHPEELEKAKAEAARKKQEEIEKVRKRLNETATAVWPGLPIGPGLPTGGTPVSPAGHGQPSTNGGNGHADPRGSQSLTPRLGGDEPSTNGGNGATDPRGSQSLTPRLGGDQPSTNGGDGGLSPSTNGSNGEAAVAEALAAEFDAILGRLRHASPAV